MPLRPLSDVSVAAWFVEADADWWTKVTLGPPGFAAYARVLYDLDEDAPGDVNHHIGRSLRDVLSRHTTTPEDCYFCLWDGFGGFEGGPQDIGLRVAFVGDPTPAEGEEAREYVAAHKRIDYAPAFDVSFVRGPKVSVPNRQFYLFNGPLAEHVDWGAADYADGLPRSYEEEPALLWPADHARFVAGDTDPDWIGVGGTQTLIDELLNDERLEVVPATYGPEQPEYR